MLRYELFSGYLRCQTKEKQKLKLSDEPHDGGDAVSVTAHGCVAQRVDDSSDTLVAELKNGKYCSFLQVVDWYVLGARIYQNVIEGNSDSICVVKERMMIGRFVVG